MSTRKPKVLFFAEGATLAHVARPLVLARSLDSDRFDVIFARPRTFAWLTDHAALRVVDLSCQDQSVFARRLERGLPLYDYRTLSRYVADDLTLIDTYKPDIIVGDFRLSLSVSARIRSIPYITLCDAYWSPELPLRPPLPVLAFTRFTPIPIAEFVFRGVSGLALRLHTIPVERLRRHYGLPSLGFDLRRCYTDADLRLFANFPALFPDAAITSSAAFIGPVAWSPPAAGNFDVLDQDEPTVYVTMGSSGDPRVLATLIPLLERLGNRILVASAGKPLPPGLSSSDSTRIFDYLPGDRACRLAKLVVCNGGSPTTNQALANGVPVLGIPQNMDQFLNMQAIERFGSGLSVRADRATTGALTSAVMQLTTDARFKDRASILERSVQSLAPEASLEPHIVRLLRDHNTNFH